jgi:hypothetical protein
MNVLLSYHTSNATIQWASERIKLPTVPDGELLVIIKIGILAISTQC